MIHVYIFLLLLRPCFKLEMDAFPMQHSVAVQNKHNCKTPN